MEFSNFPKMLFFFSFHFTSRWSKRLIFYIEVKFTLLFLTFFRKITFLTHYTLMFFSRSNSIAETSENPQIKTMHPTNLSVMTNSRTSFHLLVLCFLILYHICETIHEHFKSVPLLRFTSWPIFLTFLHVI